MRCSACRARTGQPCASGPSCSSPAAARPDRRAAGQPRRDERLLPRLADRKRVEPEDDLITFLVQAEDEDDRLDDTELLSMIFIVYVAGHITTVNLIGNGVVALLSHPDELAKVRADTALARNLVEETLRYWGPAEQTFPASRWRR